MLVFHEAFIIPNNFFLFICIFFFNLCLNISSLYGRVIVQIDIGFPQTQHGFLPA